ncbi:transcriptional regulator, AraC family [Cognatiyoonia sediminum]|uniref:Transcriptional regulator, AraC family n=1 Tax=Cognatiyoonia sediminum TaxID=1508389 RepID=A0A1M5M0N2_9RHOB|nr:AraC family transcriptional regulator [Cognatiyoonia sediminum]SHG70730.1 transcriptional regulator, AraC family [Cognatiyoonia sediminum]
MIPATEHQDALLALAPIARNPHVGKWRTEAMRSHATPRLLYIAKGQGRITIAGLTRGYGANNLIFIPAHTMYGYEIGPTVFGQMLNIPTAMAPEWPDEPVHLRLRDVAAQKDFLALIDGLERELSSDLESNQRAAHYRLGLISVFFERQLAGFENAPADANAETSSARVVAAYTDLIERDYRRDLGVADFAHALGVTPTHLTRCCKVTCGRSALALLNDRKHYEACILLRESKQTIQSISEDLGFSSAAYFSRAFQSRAGRSPSQFRRFGSKNLT